MKTGLSLAAMTIFISFAANAQTVNVQCYVYNNYHQTHRNDLSLNQMNPLSSVDGAPGFQIKLNNNKALTLSYDSASTTGTEAVNLTFDESKISVLCIKKN